MSPARHGGMRASFAGRVALVGGATRGAGRGIAACVDHLVSDEVRALVTRIEREPGGLVVEVTDGTDAYNAVNHRVSSFFDLAKAAMNRMAFALAYELRPHAATAVSLTPGWVRSEAMLDAYGFTDLDGSQPDAWRYLTEVQEAGEPADVTGYR